MRRVTVAVAADPALIAGANSVMVLLSKAEALDTYGAPLWQDAGGGLYCVSSGPWTETQIEGVKDPASYAEVIEGICADFPDIDMAAVEAAQAAFSIWEAGPDGMEETKAARGEAPPGPQAAPGRITAVIGEDPQLSLEIMGLFVVAADDQD